MFPAALTLRSVARANILSLMMACALLALLLVVAIVAALTWAADHWIRLDIGWLDATVTWIVGIATGVGGWFMLPALTVLIGGIFQETVIRRVEGNDYPGYASASEARFWPDLFYDLKFTLKALALNLLVLPLHFLGIGFAFSIALNTYLLGHEFFEGVAGYHLGKPAARRFSKKHPRSVYAGGLVITLLSLVPVANLFVPIVAVVWMVHAFHRSHEAPV